MRHRKLLKKQIIKISHNEQIYSTTTKELKGESEKDKEERERERNVSERWKRIKEQAKKAHRHAQRVQKENELLERSKYDEKAKKILENRKIQQSLEV